MKRLLVVDNLQLDRSSGASAGDADAGASTGPFSGGDQLTATISARMFATPSAALGAAATGTTGAPEPSAASSSAPASSSGSTLNNS